MAAPRPQLSFQLRAEQQMLLLPQLLQSIELLQLPAFELEQFLRSAAEENEALQLREDWQRPRSTSADSASHDALLQSQPARAPGLTELALAELATAEIAAELLPWVRLLVDHLDEAGYLSCSDETLMTAAAERGLKGDAGTLGEAVATLQSLEPRGIGARNAIEALLLQLDPRDPDYRALCRLLEEFLEELAKNKLPRVAQAMGLELGELRRLIEILAGLNPRPLAQGSEGFAARVYPDVVVEAEGEGHQVRLARSMLDAVQIDPAVDRLAHDKSQAKEVRSYLRERIERARWIVRAVEQRQATLLAVSAAVFRRQETYLRRGPGHLQPLRMAEIAAELGLHSSTVSRAVAGKHVATPWGILPLRTFFPAAAVGEEDLARIDLRERVRALIAGEDPRAPASDDELCEQLAREGHRLARRTVAKYRQELGIPSSYLRRTY